MNIHAFIGLSTLVFYVVLRMYKSSIKRKQRNNMIYVFFLPLVMYTMHFMFGNKETKYPSDSVVEVRQKSDTRVLSMSYPESSL